MGDNNTNETLKESLGLLESTNDDFVSFAIDSDDEEEAPPPPPVPEIPLKSSKKPQSASLGSADTSAGSNTAIGNFTTNANSSTKLKKQTVTANDDPLSMLLNSPTSTHNVAASSINHPTTVVSSQNRTKGTEEHFSNTSHPMYSTTNAAINSVNVNTQAVTQSLSSTFSSFASRFQDAVSNATRTSQTETITSGAVDGNKVHSYTASGPPNSTGGSYVERSLEHSYSGLSVASNITYASNASATPTIYNTVRSTAPKLNQAYLGGPNIPHDLDNTTKS